jgi:hypothetical protein
MGAEYIQVGVQDFTGYPIIRQFKTQGGDLAVQKWSSRLERRNL